MNSLAQLIHQHDFLILMGALLLGSLLGIAWFRLWSKRVITLWGTFFALTIILLLALRTPSASVSESFTTPQKTNSLAKTNTFEPPNSNINLLIDFESINEIEQYLQDGD
ncbi:MAG: hypothetical protein KDE51_17590, partial [Anaerolineales bacterium]|nr:hypothetical protein [Anaerolineales bacterium]